MTNDAIADHFALVATLLEARRVNPHRIGAWRRAAVIVRQHSQPLHALVLHDGAGAIERVPRLGAGLRLALRELIQTGRLTTLEELLASQDDRRPNQRPEQRPDQSDAGRITRAIAPTSCSQRDSSVRSCLRPAAVSR
jgi:helix-hairpin-helix protein